MKTKINIAIMIAVASISLTACVEEEVKVGPPPVTAQTTTGFSNNHTPIK